MTDLVTANPLVCRDCGKQEGQRIPHASEYTYGLCHMCPLECEECDEEDGEHTMVTQLSNFFEQKIRRE